LISLEDYEAMETTLYLLGNPTNAKLLREGIAELDSGRGVKHNTVPAFAEAARDEPHWATKAWKIMLSGSAVRARLPQRSRPNRRYPTQSVYRHWQARTSSRQPDGWWARRISDEHRLGYRVTGKRGVDQRIKIAHAGFAIELSKHPQSAS